MEESSRNKVLLAQNWVGATYTLYSEDTAEGTILVLSNPKFRGDSYLLEPDTLKEIITPSGQVVSVAKPEPTPEAQAADSSQATKKSKVENDSIEASTNEELTNAKPYRNESGNKQDNQVPNVTSKLVAAVLFSYIIQVSMKQVMGHLLLQREEQHPFFILKKNGEKKLQKVILWSGCNVMRKAKFPLGSVLVSRLP